MHTADSVTDRREQRRSLRHARRSLDPDVSCLLSASACDHVRNSAVFRASRHIAIYLPMDGETDPAALAEIAVRQGKQLYLPVVEGGRDGRLRFAPLTAGTRFLTNRYGILEPDWRQGGFARLRWLDLVLTPLVGFDARGHRMGMGGGFYDRTFAFLRHRHCWIKPKLVGLAFELQRVRQLESKPWDVPLWGIATEAGLLRTP